MRHLLGLNRVFQGLSMISSPFSLSPVARLVLLAIVTSGISDASAINAALQIAWEAPAKDASEGKPASETRVLKEIPITELEARKQTTLTEVDPIAKDGSKEPTKFQGVSLSVLIDETTKSLTAADRSTTDLVVLKTRAGREVLMPKAFLVKYPQIQLALKRNGQPLGGEAPRVVLPASSNAKIRKENMLLEPLFVSELAAVTLSNYERRYGEFFLKRRTDPAAMRGEKLFLQNCVTCHTQPQVAMSVLTSSEKVQKVAAGEHPEVPGNHGFKAIFDKKALRSLVSYLEAFRFQTAKN
jgi:hypothetical protein